MVDPPGCFRQLLGISAGLEAEAGLLYSARSLESCESVILSTEVRRTECAPSDSCGTKKRQQIHTA